ncbi:MAG: hypothetical protein ACR2O4_12305 [Hyphomicrobiaceae bacterium]
MRHMPLHRAFAIAATFFALAFSCGPALAGDTVPDAMQDAELNPLYDTPLDTLTATTGRPLFSPGRRPPVKAPSRVVRKPDKTTPPRKTIKRAKPKNPFKLVGIIAGRESRVALLQHEQSTRYLNGRKGDRLRGWKIVSVGQSDVLIENDGVRVQLVVFK